MSNKTNTEFGFSVGALIVGLALILGINSLVGGAFKGAAVPADMSDEAIAARIAPVGKVNTGPAIEPEAPAAAPVAAVTVTSGGRSGEDVYQASCFGCHGIGAAGAPMTGDAAAWGPRAAQGMATLLDHAVNGFTGDKGMMPPRGTCGDCSDDELKAAVEYMVENSK